MVSVTLSKVAVVSYMSNELSGFNPCPRCPQHKEQDLKQ